MTASLHEATRPVVAMSIVSREHEPSDRRPQPPGDHLAQLLGELLSQAGAWHARLDDLRRSPDAMTGLEPGLDAVPARACALVATGQLGVRTELKALVASARTSLDWYRPDIDVPGWGGIKTVARRTSQSLDVRVLVGCSARDLPAAMDQFAACGRDGADVRLTGLPQERTSADPVTVPADQNSGACGYLVLDGRITVISAVNANGESVLYRIDDPLVVTFSAASFHAAWHAGVPMTEVSSLLATLDTDVKRAVLRLLVAGGKDEAIARTVGLSLRTCRRHVAEILTIGRANSRFQAGFALARAAWVLESVGAL